MPRTPPALAPPRSCSPSSASSASSPKRADERFQFCSSRSSCRNALDSLVVFAKLRPRATSLPLPTEAAAVAIGAIGLENASGLRAPCFLHRDFTGRIARTLTRRILRVGDNPGPCPRHPQTPPASEKLLAKPLTEGKLKARSPGSSTEHLFVYNWAWPLRHSWWAIS
jgi:hypothetical protein